MIIIRKPRRKGWSELMLAALKVARTCFANANEAKEDDELEQEKYWVERGQEWLTIAADNGGFFSVRDMQLWIEHQAEKLERS